MTEITRQHLEDAALAAGLRHVNYEGSEYDGGDGLVLADDIGRRLDDWRPHLDDGDAFRLATAVGMKVTAPKHRGDGASAEPIDGKSRSVTVYRSDRCEQMRTAIVLCAAAVGERMRSAK